MDTKKITTLAHQEFSNVRVLVDIEDYHVEDDPRLLIPFSYYQHFGLMNRAGEVVVEPKYDRILDSCRKADDVVRVAKHFTYGYNRATKEPSTYIGSKYGLIDSAGNIILDTEYCGIGVSDDNTLLTLHHMDFQYEVINIDGEVIVPKGKYQWIDSFDHGYARVKRVEAGEEKCGLIDSHGNEVLPMIYSNIWNFYKKNRTWITVEAIDENGNKRVGKFDFKTGKLTI